MEQAAGRWGDGVAMQVVLPASVAGPRGGEPPWCGGEDGGCGGRGWGARREAAGRVGSDGRKPGRVGNAGGVAGRMGRGGCGGRSGDEERPRKAFALGGRSAAAALRYVAP